jgi:AraC-like DNA-binding protein
MPDHSGIVLHESGYLPQNQHWSFPHVFSPFWRVYYNFCPGHKLLFPECEIPLGPDRLVIIPDRRLFHTVGIKKCPHLWLHFNCARQLVPPQDIPIQLKPLPSELILMKELRRLFSLIHRENNRPRIMHYSLALLQVVLSRPEINWQTPKPMPIFQAIEHIEKHYAQSLYTAELGRLVGMSESTFRRLFRQHHGTTPVQFIMQVRVRVATRLLMETDFTLDEIAQQIGFPNRSYFTRAFTRQTRQPPATFRRQHQRGNKNMADIPCL